MIRHEALLGRDEKTQRQTRLVAQTQAPLNSIESHRRAQGSWLNMAELEMSARPRICLSQRIPLVEVLDRAVRTLVKERSSSSVKLTGCAFLGMPAEYRRHARSYNNYRYRALVTISPQ